MWNIRWVRSSMLMDATKINAKLTVSERSIDRNDIALSAFAPLLWYIAPAYAVVPKLLSLHLANFHCGLL